MKPMLAAAVAALFCVATAGAAPVLHVVAVAAKDTLNLSASPDAKSAKTGALPPDATGISVGTNLAIHNSGWGIRVPNATDLGGNHAHHNGNSPQCVGVVC